MLSSRRYEKSMLTEEKEICTLNICCNPVSLTGFSEGKVEES